MRDVLQSKSSARMVILPPHLHSFSINFHCSYSEIHTDSRSLGWSKKSFRKSFYQARFSYVCITNQYNFEQIAVVFHFLSDTKSINTLNYKWSKEFLSRYFRFAIPLINTAKGKPARVLWKVCSIFNGK